MTDLEKALNKIYEHSCNEIAKAGWLAKMIEIIEEIKKCIEGKKGVEEIDMGYIDSLRKKLEEFPDYEEIRELKLLLSSFTGKKDVQPKKESDFLFEISKALKFASQCRKFQYSKIGDMIVLWNKGKYEDVAKFMKSILINKNDDELALNILAMSLAKLGRIEEAMKYLSRSIMIKPTKEKQQLFEKLKLMKSPQQK